MDAFNVRDGIMRPFTYEDAVIMLRNINPERGDVWQIMRRELRKWVSDSVNDMMFCLEQNKDAIWAEAFPDERRPLKNAPGWTPERLESLAWDIHRWLRGHDMWIDVCIYYDGKRMSTTRHLGDDHLEFRYNSEPFIEDGFDPRDYFEYVAEPHILSMSFESTPYEMINGYVSGNEDFQKVFAKYGIYYELGDHWNLTCYER